MKQYFNDGAQLKAMLAVSDLQRIMWEVYNAGFTHVTMQLGVIDCELSVFCHSIEAELDAKAMLERYDSNNADVVVSRLEREPYYLSSVILKKSLRDYVDDKFPSR